MIRWPDGDRPKSLSQWQADYTLFELTKGIFWEETKCPSKLNLSRQMGRRIEAWLQDQQCSIKEATHEGDTATGPIGTGNPNPGPGDEQQWETDQAHTSAWLWIFCLIQEGMQGERQRSYYPAPWSDWTFVYMLYPLHTQHYPHYHINPRDYPIATDTQF